MQIEAMAGVGAPAADTSVHAHAYNLASCSVDIALVQRGVRAAAEDNLRSARLLLQDLPAEPAERRAALRAAQRLREQSRAVLRHAGTITVDPAR